MGCVNPSTAQATVLVDELIAAGVRQVVLAPGSRSAPLALALAEAERVGRLHLHVRTDERTAAFLALGWARGHQAVGGSPSPAAVVTTSGTAVANLYPAVLEAHHGAVPLLLLTADRPPQLRGVGANQTIDQPGLFAEGTLRWRHDLAVAARRDGQNGYWRAQICRAVAAARGATGAPPGPVHLNVPFADPLVPDPLDVPVDDQSAADPWPEPLTGRGGPWTVVGSGRAGMTWPIAAPDPQERCLFIAAAGHASAAVIAAAGQPVIGEVGGLAGAASLAAGIHLLADPSWMAAHRPDRVIVLGRPTMYRAVTGLLARSDIVIDLVDHPAAHADVAGSARRVAPQLADGVPAAPAPWMRVWRTGDAAAREAIDIVLAGEGPTSSAVLARTLAAALPDEAVLVLGSSQPPRDIGRFTAARAGVTVVANRGVAGIDGTVSTAIGAGLATGRPTHALMGDLTFLHDLTGLAIGPADARPDLTIVVAHNDGGGIFATLEQGAATFADSFERVFGTPVGADLASVAAAFGVRYRRITHPEALADAVSQQPEGMQILEVPVDRTRLRHLQERVADAVRQALTPLV